MGIYQSMSNWKNRNHSRYFKQRGFNIGNWLQGYWRPGDEKGDTEIVKINHIYGWWNKREEMVSPDLGVQRKEPHGWCAGMICSPLVEGLYWGWWLALGVLKEAWGWSCGSFLLLHRDADRSQKTERQLFCSSCLPISNPCVPLQKLPGSQLAKKSGKWI